MRVKQGREDHGENKIKQAKEELNIYGPREIQHAKKKSSDGFFPALPRKALKNHQHRYSYSLLHWGPVQAMARNSWHAASYEDKARLLPSGRIPAGEGSLYISI